MSQNLADALAYSERWLELISKPSVSMDEGKTIIEESKNNFAEYFNKGWLDYRKSVTEAGDWACVEWTGRGAIFKDVLGREYIDCLGGYGMMDHGWSHPDVVAAVAAQLQRTPMPSQELIDPLRGVLARLMADITPGDIQYSFFCASGTEAIEGAIKLAKMYTKKSAFIVATKAFHGKTMGSLSMMGKADYRAPPGMLYGGPVYHVPYGDAAAVEQQLDICDTVGIGVAAVLMEPIQGEAGAIVPPDDFWPRIRKATKEHGVLLIADEVQTGLGRTGKLWGVDHWDVKPDILAVAKSLGGGVMPISAFCSTEEIWQCMMYPQSLHPHHHHRRRRAGLLGCHRLHQRGLEGRLPQTGQGKGRLHHAQTAGPGSKSTLTFTTLFAAKACSSASISRAPKSATKLRPACSNAASWWLAPSPAPTPSASNRPW